MKIKKELPRPVEQEAVTVTKEGKLPESVDRRIKCHRRSTEWRRE